jgi:hypothetical protein
MPLHIEQNGFLKGFFLGCDVIEGRFGPMNPPSYVTSQLQGFVWPYYLLREKNELETPKSIEDISAAFAQKLVADNNKRIGEQLDENTMIQKASFEGNTVNLRYKVSSSFFNFISITKKTFSEHVTSQTCSGDETMDEMFRYFLSTGNEIKVSYEDQLTAKQVVIVVSSCPS